MGHFRSVVEGEGRWGLISFLRERENAYKKNPNGQNEIYINKTLGALGDFRMTLK